MLLKLIKEDFILTDGTFVEYVNGNYCPVARALKRNNIPFTYVSAEGVILNGKINKDYHSHYSTPYNNRIYKKLCDKFLNNEITEFIIDYPTLTIS